MIIIKKIETIEEITRLSNELLSVDKKYNSFFNPFEFDKENLISLVLSSKLDYYFLMIYNHKIVGFFMIRGFDEGFDIPSYGVWIHPDYNNKGLAKLSLSYTISLLKLKSKNKVMLKVHPSNLAAKKIYESSGFYLSHTDEKNKNLVYYREL
ncbi:MAG TPA: GNAT family N-acetyltransferase [Victivallales bacterium]|nr:GNAT family N-acetyltransferase [Victivallales bacterium]